MRHRRNDDLRWNVPHVEPDDGFVERLAALARDAPAVVATGGRSVAAKATIAAVAVVGVSVGGAWATTSLMRSPANEPTSPISGPATGGTDSSSPTVSTGEPGADVSRPQDAPATTSSDTRPGSSPGSPPPSTPGDPALPDPTDVITPVPEVPDATEVSPTTPTSPVTPPSNPTVEPTGPPPSVPTGPPTTTPTPSVEPGDTASDTTGDQPDGQVGDAPATTPGDTTYDGDPVRRGPPGPIG